MYILSDANRISLPVRVTDVVTTYSEWSDQQGIMARATIRLSALRTNDIAVVLKAPFLDSLHVISVEDDFVDREVTLKSFIMANGRIGTCIDQMWFVDPSRTSYPWRSFTVYDAESYHWYNPPSIDTDQ